LAFSTGKPGISLEKALSPAIGFDVAYIGL
jgi:hypothetical protein